MKGVGATLATVATLSTAVLATPTLKPRASASSTGTLPTVTVKGNAFWTSDSDRFYVQGVDYQPGGSSANEDPLVDESTCTRDIKYFKDLGVNTIRVYAVDNAKNHDACMKALDEAGIYLALDVNNPSYSINRDQPWISYNDKYLQSVFAVIDTFAKYTNTLLFFSGNEVINDDTTTQCAPYVKAVTRDMKAYIQARGYRSIPVGYSAADVDSNRYEMATYMNCGSDSVRSDFFAFNDYSWCDPSTFQESGWQDKVTQYGNYSIPLFLSEYGCIKNPPREFNDVLALFSDQMSAVYSGGLVYEYSDEADNPGYGLVTINGDSVTPRSDFNTLKTQLGKTSLPSGDGGYLADGSASSCPASSSTWDVKNNSLPEMPAPAQKYLSNGAGSGPGLNGGGSQTAGTQSSGWVSVDANSTVSGSGSSASSSGAAVSNVKIPEMTIAPFVAGMVVLVSTMFGAAAIF
jgi:hypothetical protein